jgi:hypothetical protein
MVVVYDKTTERHSADWAGTILLLVKSVTLLDR